MLLKHKKTGEVFPYTEELFKSGKVSIYEPLLYSIDDECLNTNDDIDYEGLKRLPNDVIADKDLMEQIIGKLLSVTEHKRIMEKLHYGD